MSKQQIYIIRILREYAYEGHYHHDIMFDKSPEFLDEYYSRQAALDLIEEIMDHKSQRPIDTVENYRFKMDKYSTMNPDFGIIYAIKYDFATYILDRLIA